MATRVIYSSDRGVFIACSEMDEETKKELEKIFLSFFAIIKPPSWIAYWIKDKMVIMGKMDVINQEKLVKFGISGRDLLYIDANIFGKEEFKRYIENIVFISHNLEHEYVAKLYKEAEKNKKTQLIEPTELDFKNEEIKEKIENFLAWCFYNNLKLRNYMVLRSKLLLIQELLSSLLHLYSYGICLNIILSFNDKIDIKATREKFDVILLVGDGTEIEVFPKDKPPRTCEEIKEIMYLLDKKDIKVYFELEQGINEINKNPDILKERDIGLLKAFISYNFEKINTIVKKEVILKIFEKDNIFIENLLKKRARYDFEEILNHLVDKTDNLKGLKELLKCEILNNVHNVKGRALLRLINEGYYRDAVEIVEEDKEWEDLLNANIIQELKTENYSGFCKELSNREMWEIHQHVTYLRHDKKRFYNKWR